MKIVIFVLNLAALATLVLSFNSNGILLRRLYGDIDAEESIVKCNENAMDYINDCVPSDKNSFSKDNIDNLCTKIHSEECQIFLSNPMVSLDGCEDLPYIKNKNVSLVFFKLISSNTKLHCTKDENEEYCPMSNFNLFKGSNPQDFDIFNTIPKDDVFNKTMPNICKSNKCYQATYDYFSYIKNYTEVETDKLIGFKGNKNFTTDLHNFSSKVIKYLKAENCTIKAEASKRKYETIMKMKYENDESGAFSNKMNYCLFFLIILFISVFFLNSN
ncbi:hypothetical protein BCR32DRAFT_329702 [Anaeromyces robustus]|uniref:Uncharacterized protein n=1 Tax=Anaeromyces robustus TaxID=1754192 RepID=A0A1Y1WQW5_9FUNG|nr:hypothetical protein BCR32DRAFT_329702 [Anaeromyces robustus]|eukprot:ORX75666.1 hypothetical protein BCR32DRAFT_329702 [Anaeromyces robustus]